MELLCFCGGCLSPCSPLCPPLLMLSRLPSRLLGSPLLARSACAAAVARAPAAAAKHTQMQRTQQISRVSLRGFTRSCMRLADAPAKVAAESTAPATSAPVRATSIVLTAAGPDRPGIVHDVCATLSAQAQANIEESRMTILGNDFAIILRITVPETQTAAGIAQMLTKAFPDFVVSGRATTTHPIFTSPVRIFSVAVEGPDQPGIVQILTNLFLEHKGSIRDLDTDTSNAPFAGYKIFSLKSVVALPINVRTNTQHTACHMRVERLHIH